MTIPERHLADARSKKKIYLYDTDDLEYIREKTKTQDIHDRFDCLCVFEFKLIEALRLFEKFSDEYNRIYLMFTFNEEFFNDQTFMQEMASLGLVTSVDRGTYGKSLLKHFFIK